jgi:hypothetical protein
MAVSSPAPPQVVNLGELETVAGPDGLRWIPLRRVLGVRVVGINGYLADAGGQVVEEHTETGGGAGGHEELYLVVSGSATFTLDGETHPAPAGTLVHCPSVTTRRSAVADVDGTLVLALGGPVGEPYRPGAWEWSFAAAPVAAGGDHEAAAAILEEGLVELPGDVSLTYNLACYRSLAGRLDEALELLTAIASEPQVAGWAEHDSDLDPIRTDPRYPL